MTKRQQSSIDRLPEDIREKFHALLRDPRVTQLDATAKINEILEKEGLDQQLSKSAVNRYAVSMEKVGAKLRESREVAKMWIGQLGSEPAGEVGKLLNEMVRTLAFRAAMKASEGDEDIDPKELKNLAIAVHRLEQAASKNADVEKKIRDQERERAKEAAAKVVDAAAEEHGMDAETLKEISEKIKLL